MNNTVGKLQIYLDVKEVEVVLSALAELPIKVALPIFNNIKLQAEKQLSADPKTTIEN